jgi:hypothetical protein
MVGNLSMAPKKLERALVVSRQDTSKIKGALAAEGFKVVEGPACPQKVRSYSR